MSDQLTNCDGGLKMERANISDFQQQLSADRCEKVRTHLGKILVSAPFSHSQRSRSFVQYGVEEHLEGRCSQIKGRNIAVDVFGKSENCELAEKFPITSLHSVKAMPDGQTFALSLILVIGGIDQRQCVVDPLHLSR
jgi:hypothetical protein